MRFARIVLAASWLLAWWPAASQDDRVALLDASDPAYASLAAPEGARLVPRSRTRLVVFRGGRCVLDRGLRDDRTLEPSPERKGTVEERGFVEEATVAPDGRSALVVTVRYSDSVVLGKGDRAGNVGALRGRTAVVMIDSEHPGGRWTLELEPGRFVAKAIALSLRRGAALSTSGIEGGGADFRLIAADGRGVLTISEDRASVGDIVATDAGGFVAIDLAFRPGDGVPDRGILVLDLLQNREWTYAWDYGSEREPLGWTLENTGILEVRLPGRTLRFDRNGGPLDP